MVITKDEKYFEPPQELRPVPVATSPPPPPQTPPPPPARSYPIIPPEGDASPLFKVLVFVGLVVVAFVILIKSFDVHVPDINCPSLTCQNLSIPPCPGCPGINVTYGDNNTLVCPKSLYYIDYEVSNETCQLLNETIINITNTSITNMTYDCWAKNLNVSMAKWVNGNFTWNISMPFMGNGTYLFENVTTNETWEVKIEGS